MTPDQLHALIMSADSKERCVQVAAALAEAMVTDRLVTPQMLVTMAAAIVVLLQEAAEYT